MSARILLGTAHLQVELDVTGGLIGISEGGTAVEFAVDEWSIEIDGEFVGRHSLVLRSVHEDGRTAVLTFETPGKIEVVVRWAVRDSAQSQFVQREIVVRAPHGFRVGVVRSRIRTVDVPDLLSEIRTFSEAPFAAVARLGRISLLTGVQNPHVRVDLGEGIRSDYTAALTAEGHFEATPQFFALAAHSGMTIQPEPPKTRVGVGEKRHRGRFRNPSEALALDLAEIAVLRSVVRDFLSPVDSRVRFILYTYWLPLPHLPTTEADEQLWVEVIDDFADLGGDLFLTVPLVAPTVPDLSPDAFWDLEPDGSVAAKIMAHARSRGLEVGYYMGVAADNLPFGNEPGLGLPIDGPFSWRKVTPVGELGLENCLAAPEYRQWLTRVHANTIRRFGLAAWSWDPGPGDGRNCFSSEHGHLPGLGDHKGWLAGQEHIAELHKMFPGLHLQGFYGQKEDGTWGLRGITQHEGYWEQQAEWGAGIYPDLSAERLNANGVRQQAWWSQNFRFIPAELNHALFGRMSQMCLEPQELGRTFDYWGWRFALLSALALGGSPTASTIPTRHAPSWVRSEVSEWIAWAKSTAGRLEIDVAGGSQVRLGGLDWYFRSTQAGSWLFVANPGPRPARAEIRLEHDRARELLAGRQLRRLTPFPGDVWPSVDDTKTIPDSANFEIEVPAYEVLVLQVEEAGTKRVAGPSARALDSVPVSLDGWRDLVSREPFTIPNPSEVDGTTISFALPGALFEFDQPKVDVPADLRARYPRFPDTFAYTDPGRIILLIPILDADSAPSVSVAVDGVAVPTHLFAYRHAQMERLGVEPMDVAQWPETGVVWWSDLTQALSASASELSIELSGVPAESFLGPVLQVPSQLAASFDPPSVVYTAPIGKDHRVTRPPTGAPAPRIVDAWVTPVAIRAGSEFTITARVADAEQVFVSLHVGGGNMYDRKLTPVADQHGVWSVTARVRDRAAMILSPREFVLWCEDHTHRRSGDFRVAAHWIADLLAEE